jgi:hypothetical protein
MRLLPTAFQVWDVSTFKQNLDKWRIYTWNLLHYFSTYTHLMRLLPTAFQVWDVSTFKQTLDKWRIYTWNSLHYFSTYTHLILIVANFGTILEKQASYSVVLIGHYSIMTCLHISTYLVINLTPKGPRVFQWKIGQNYLCWKTYL